MDSRNIRMVHTWTAEIITPRHKEERAKELYMDIQKGNAKVIVLTLTFIRMCICTFLEAKKIYFNSQLMNQHLMGQAR